MPKSVDSHVNKFMVIKIHHQLLSMSTGGSTTKLEKLCAHGGYKCPPPPQKKKNLNLICVNLLAGTEGP